MPLFFPFICLQPPSCLPSARDKISYTYIACNLLLKLDQNIIVVRWHLNFIEWYVLIDSVLHTNSWEKTNTWGALEQPHAMSRHFPSVKVRPWLDLPQEKTIFFAACFARNARNIIETCRITCSACIIAFPTGCTPFAWEILGTVACPGKIVSSWMCVHAVVICEVSLICCEMWSKRLTHILSNGWVKSMLKEFGSTH